MPQGARGDSSGQDRHEGQLRGQHPGPEAAETQAGDHTARCECLSDGGFLEFVESYHQVHFLPIPPRIRIMTSVSLSKTAIPCCFASFFHSTRCQAVCISPDYQMN